MPCTSLSALFFRWRRLRVHPDSLGGPSRLRRGGSVCAELRYPGSSPRLQLKASPHAVAAASGTLRRTRYWIQSSRLWVRAVHKAMHCTFSNPRTRNRCKP